MKKGDDDDDNDNDNYNCSVVAWLPSWAVAAAWGAPGQVTPVHVCVRALTDMAVVSPD